MDLIDMKNTGTDDSVAVPSEGKPDYPWGLSLSLDDAVLAKLGMDSLPSVGSSMRLEARVKVTSVSQHERNGDGKDRQVSLQITALALDDDADQTSPADRLFGS